MIIKNMHAGDMFAEVETVDNGAVLDQAAAMEQNDVLHTEVGSAEAGAAGQPKPQGNTAKQLKTAISCVKDTGIELLRNKRAKDLRTKFNQLLL